MGETVHRLLGADWNSSYAVVVCVSVKRGHTLSRPPVRFRDQRPTPFAGCDYRDTLLLMPPEQRRGRNGTSSAFSF
ncbi:hypothetical protein JTE90_019815 [Oedothorax gibbosus]|uniref:Uncharacterized protein n=1 Tax=Oedothorax gibbosus TaxID=931172 RepID=A0AAV6V537_9ARAC|nr:hypothetical protein JTE90_019815 [Oedothorax gibbosus]